MLVQRSRQTNADGSQSLRVVGHARTLSHVLIEVTAHVKDLAIHQLQRLPPDRRALFSVHATRLPDTEMVLETDGYCTLAEAQDAWVGVLASADLEPAGSRAAPGDYRVEIVARLAPLSAEAFKERARRGKLSAQRARQASLDKSLEFGAHSAQVLAAVTAYFAARPGFRDLVAIVQAYAAALLPIEAPWLASFGTHYQFLGFACPFCFTRYRRDGQPVKGSANKIHFVEAGVCVPRLLTALFLGMDVAAPPVPPPTPTAAWYALRFKAEQLTALVQAYCPELAAPRRRELWVTSQVQHDPGRFPASQLDGILLYTDTSTGRHPRWPTAIERRRATLHPVECPTPVDVNRFNW